MAWLETKGSVYRIRFRFGGMKHLLALHTSNKKEAVDSLARFEANLRLIERGIIDTPDGDVDVGIYIMSGGKLLGSPALARIPKRSTLANLFDSYVTTYPKAAKEISTWKTEMTHITHLRRLLDVRLALADVTQKTMQDYINARSKDIGVRKQPIRRETIQKELGTLSAVWNKWGVPQGMTDRRAPVANLIYPKGRAKPPFQTRQQIEQEIFRQNLTTADQAELWESLFLSLDEVEAFLNHVQAARRPPYVYPMMVFAAHTGARRSEIRRSLVKDLDFDTKTLVIREKKKDHDKVETYRSVPMSPRLQEAMRDWFRKHYGGANTFCTPSGRGIIVQYAAKIIRAATRRSKWAVIPGWHCLRHSFISNCAARGVDQRLIDHWVGHTTEEMRQRYSHLLPAVSQAALLSVFGQCG